MLSKEFPKCLAAVIRATVLYVRENKEEIYQNYDVDTNKGRLDFDVACVAFEGRYPDGIPSPMKAPKDCQAYLISALSLHVSGPNSKKPSPSRIIRILEEEIEEDVIRRKK